MNEAATMAQNNMSEGPGGAEKINVDIVTLSRYLSEEQTKHKEATGDFTYVVLLSLGQMDTNAQQASSAMAFNSPSSR